MRITSVFVLLLVFVNSSGKVLKFAENYQGSASYEVCSMQKNSDRKSECGWNDVDVTNRLSLGDGGHSKEECLNACTKRKECNYAAFSNTGYCHLFETCDGSEGNGWTFFEKRCMSDERHHVRYEVLTSGECTDVGSYIETEEECRAAAASVGWPVDDKFLVASRGDWPPGCWLNYVGNKARFNTMSDSTEPCQNIDRCLCKVEFKGPTYEEFGKSQCFTSNTQYPGDRADNPIFGGGGFDMVGTAGACKTKCDHPNTIDSRGRRCVAFEHSSQDAHVVANCAFAWDCSEILHWGGGKVYRRTEVRNASIFSATSEDECIHEIFDIGRVFGKEAHTIHVKLEMPEYSEPRQWILNLGQETTGANHWIWRGENIQFGSWNGAQIRTVEINSCTDLTTTFDGRSTLTLYCNGKYLGQIENSNLNVRNSNLAVAGNQRYEVPRGNFGGCVHHVEVWDYDLSSREVASLTNNAPTKPSVGY